MKKYNFTHQLIRGVLSLFFVYLTSHPFGLLAQEDENKLSRNSNHALIIGIENYRNYRSMTNARVNSKKIHDLMVNTFKVPDENIKFLTDDHATKSDILSMLSWLNSKTSSGDKIYFYFCGNAVSHNNDIFIMPYDSMLEHIDITGIRVEEVADKINNTQVKKALLIIDTNTSIYSISSSTSFNPNIHYYSAITQSDIIRLTRKVSGSDSERKIYNVAILLSKSDNNMEKISTLFSNFSHSNPLIRLNNSLAGFSNFAGLYPTSFQSETSFHHVKMKTNLSRNLYLLYNIDKFKPEEFVLFQKLDRRKVPLLCPSGYKIDGSNCVKNEM